MQKTIKAELIIEPTFEELITSNISNILQIQGNEREDLFNIAETWKIEMIAKLRTIGLFCEIDITSLELGKMIYFNLLISQRDLLLNGFYLEDVSGNRYENPSNGAFRAYSKQFQSWLNQHGCTPISRFVKKINLQDYQAKPAHGNTKFLDAINSMKLIEE